MEQSRTPRFPREKTARAPELHTSAQCKNRRTAGWHTVAALLAANGAFKRAFKRILKHFYPFFVIIFYQLQECHPGLPCPCQRMSRRGEATSVTGMLVIIAITQHSCSLLSSSRALRSHGEVAPHDRSCCGQPAVRLAATTVALPFALIAAAGATAAAAAAASVSLLPHDKQRVDASCGS